MVGDGSTAGARPGAILLVEDQRIVALYEKAVYERNGFSVTHVETGEDAVALVDRGQHVDLILMDLDLGDGIDGAEATRRILSRKHVPVVFLTAHDEATMLSRVRGIPRYGYILKGAPDTVLLEVAYAAIDLFEESRRSRAQLSASSAVLASMSDFVFVLDGDYRFREVYAPPNAALLVAREEAIGMRADEVLPSTVSTQFCVAADRVRATGLTEHFVYSLGEAGETEWFSCTVDRHKDGDGVVAVARSISHARQLEEELRDSRQLFARVFYQAGQMMVITELSDGSVVEVNDRALRMLGYTREEALGTALLDIGLVDQPTVDRIAREVLRNGELRDFEMELHLPSGASAWVIYNAQTMNLAGRPVLLSAAQDITKRKGLAEELADRERQYRLLADSAQDMIVVMDDSLHASYASPATTWMTGYTPEEYCDLPLEEFIHPEDLAAVRATVAKTVRERRETNRARFRAVRKDGRVIWIESRARYSYRGDGSVDRIQAHLRDVSEQVAAEESLKRKTDDVERLLKEKELLLREVNHRIKNDLNLVGALLHLHADRSDDEKVREALREAGGRVATLGRVYDALRQSSGAGSVPIRAMLQSLVGSLQASTVRDDLAVDVDVADVTVPSQISVAAGMIVNELLTNAMKYAFVNTIDPRVRLSVRAVGPGHIDIAVADNGIGAPDAVLSGESLGYGLSVAGALASQHGGALVLNDNSPGTLARVTLRYSPSELSA